jgi:hypothetical protein
MISGPEPDWIDEVMRAWMSLALMVSTSSLIPVAFWHSSVIWPLSSWSEAGTKSAQRSQCTALACAKAGARPVARMAARPLVLAAMAPAPDSFRIVRRVMRAMFPPVYCCATEPRVLGRALARTEASNRGFMAVASSRVHPDATPVENTPIRPKPLPQSGRGRRARSGLIPASCFQRWRSASIVASDLVFTAWPDQGERRATESARR